MQLFKEYKMVNGDIIIFDGVSMYQDQIGKPIDIYTSNKYDGQWNKNGQYLTNIIFLNGKPSDMDIQK